MPPVPYEAPEHLSLCLTADRSDHVLQQHSARLVFKPRYSLKRAQLLHVTCIFDYIIITVTLGRAWAQKMEPDIRNLKHILKFKKGKHMIKYLFLI